MSGALHDFLAAVRAELGHAPDAERVRPGEFTRFSTNGKPGNRDGWLKWFADGCGGCYGCKRQGITETWQAGAARYLSPADRMQREQQRREAQQRSAEQQRQQWHEAGERNARLWAACRPLSAADAAGRYLRHRLRCLPAVLPTCLRFHPGLDYWHDGERLGTFPALVATITSPAGELLALHRTYLDPSGRKASLPDGAPVKKLTRAAGYLMGGCVRLAEPDAAGLLGVAEGIETALAASMAGGLPVVAAYSAGALAAWQWPAAVRHIVVCADNDPAGAAAAHELGQRALSAGLRVHVAAPSAPGLDWCDIWASRDECEPQHDDEGAAQHA
ncbi:MAG: hypothetical protein RIQ60_1912 [Pseudomonadota bacterium]|jgi:phage/plasmid primase-like uncharacterized protein